MAFFEYILANPFSSLIAGGVIVYVGVKLVEYLPLVPVLLSLPKTKYPDQYEPNIVYLHHWPHSWTRQVPNLSPYSMKLECWMRLNKIKYEIIETVKQSKDTKQLPYIIYNGESISESNNIIEVLSERLNIDKTEGLTPEQLAVSRAFQRMIEDSTAWTIFVDRYLYKPDLYGRVCRLAEAKHLAKRVMAVLTKNFQKRASFQGIGRQSKEMVERTGKSDVKAISDYLGTKPFIMGDKITTTDCFIFGHICQLLCADFPYFHKEALSDNVEAYLNRIKEQLWPDWNIRVNEQPFDS